MTTALLADTAQMSDTSKFGEVKFSSWFGNLDQQTYVHFFVLPNPNTRMLTFCSYQEIENRNKESTNQALVP